LPTGVSVVAPDEMVGASARGAEHNRCMARPDDMPCPCRVREAAPVRYADCCGRWHEGLARGEHAPTPEALMRSRYSAYALVQGHRPASPATRAYLMQTWHASCAPGELELGPLQWTGLEILHEETRGDAGAVEFVAHHKVNGRAAKLHEVSRFVREGGAWRYVDGVVAPAGED
jgi:SEC-C motif domain protein